MNKMLAYLFLTIYVLISLIHLKDSFNDEQDKRKKTKPFLLLFLILYYLFMSEEVSLLVFFTLVCCWIGDVVLTQKGNMYFVIGGISFLIAHILLVFLYSKRINLALINWPLTLFIMAFYLFAIIQVMKIVKDNISLKMFIPMTIYLICNFFMNAFAIMQLQCNKSFGEVILVIGAIMFFISDSALFIVRYAKKKDIIYHNHFFVMLTYLVAMFLICNGVLLLGLS